MSREASNSLINLGGLTKPANTLIEKISKYNRHGINFDTLSHLDSIGLIQFGPMSGFRENELPKRLTVFYYDRSLTLEMGDSPNNDIAIGKVLLTRVGQELAPICGSMPVEGFWEYVKGQWSEYLPKTEKSNG